MSQDVVLRQYSIVWQTPCHRPTAAALVQVLPADALLSVGCSARTAGPVATPKTKNAEERCMDITLRWFRAATQTCLGGAASEGQVEIEFSYEPQACPPCSS